MTIRRDGDMIPTSRRVLTVWRWATIGFLWVAVLGDRMVNGNTNHVVTGLPLYMLLAGIASMFFNVIISLSQEAKS